MQQLLPQPKTRFTYPFVSNEGYTPASEFHAGMWGRRLEVLLVRGEFLAINALIQNICTQQKRRDDD